MIAGVIAAALCLILFLMGQPVVCKGGDWWYPWAGDVWSSHNSQHLLDPYSFTHISHGLLFFWVLRFLLPGWTVARRFVVAVFLESVWEIVENSPWIIRQYRENTVSLEYFGDSVLNSLGDLLCCSAGFWAAAAGPWWLTVAVFSLFEITLLLTIRDNLILNILNLTGDHPQLIQWQSKARP